MTRAQFDKETFGYPKKGEIGFTQDPQKKYRNFDTRTAHLKRCFYNRDDASWKYDTKNVLIKLWKKAKDLKDFKNLVRNDKEAKLTQFAAVIFKDDEGFLYELVKDRCFSTYADAGSVKVGNENFSFFVSSGGGDGDVICAIFEDSKEFNSSAYNFQTIISGNFNIYSYDCGNDIEKRLNGKYAVYSKSGFVCLEKL